jgi:predicted enzyme related to lactoylglutathione lyase
VGVQPVMDEAYYVGFHVEGQDIGLDPQGHRNGMTGPVGYWHVDEIKATVQALLDAGAEAQQEVKDVGGGKLTASVRDADGNLIGLIQPA